MTVTPYDRPEAGKKEQVRDMFDNISGTYDLLNRMLSLGIDKRWRKQLLSQLVKHQPKNVLDVATGTGDVALAIAKQVPTVQEVIGLDLSPGMLAIGKKKVDKNNLQTKVDMVEGDSEDLPYDTGHFDATTVAFGVRNFENLEKGLSEMHRILRKGGRIFVLEFSKPKAFPFKQLFHTYFRYVLPVIGRITSNDKKAYRYLFESVQAFPEGNDFLTILEAVGFERASCKPLTFGICSLYIAEK